MPSVNYLTRTQTIAESEYFVKLLLYGPPGVGKTRFCADAPKPIWFDVERSAETFRRIPELAEQKFLVPETFDEMFDFAKQIVKDKAYETIVIDTIGQAQDNNIRQYLETETNHGAKRSKYLALWADYRISTEMLSAFFQFLQDSPIHVILIAHDKEEIHPETKNIVRIRPDLTPALAKGITGLVNVVAYMETTSTPTGAITRKLTVNPIGKIIAKNRLNIQEPTIKEPNFKEIFLND